MGSGRLSWEEVVDWCLEAAVDRGNLMDCQTLLEDVVERW